MGAVSPKQLHHSQGDFISTDCVNSTEFVQFNMYENFSEELCDVSSEAEEAKTFDIPLGSKNSQKNTGCNEKTEYKRGLF